MKIKITALMLAAAIAAGGAYAQDKATLDLLVSKGVITKEDAAKISKPALAISAKEKTTKKLTFSGRLQGQYQFINAEDGSGAASAESKNGFQLRRIYLGVKADIGNGFYGTITADFAKTAANGANYLEEAFLTKKVDLDYLTGDLNVGYGKINFGYEEKQSSAKLLTIERSVATRYFMESQKSGSGNLGFGSHYTGAWWDGTVRQIEGLEYSLAVTNSQNYTLAPGGDSNSVNVFGSVAYKGKADIGSGLGYKAGVNLGYGPSANASSVLGGPENGEIFGVNPYVELSYGGFSMWADFLMANVQYGKRVAGALADATPMGFNVAAEYKFDIGEYGALAPTVRYSWLDTDGRGAAVGDTISKGPKLGGLFNAAQSVYVGLNWYIMGNSAKIQAGYEWAQFNDRVSGAVDRVDVNAMRVQMQVLF